MNEGMMARGLRDCAEDYAPKTGGSAYGAAAIGQNTQGPSPSQYIDERLQQLHKMSEAMIHHAEVNLEFILMPAEPSNEAVCRLKPPPMPHLHQCVDSRLDDIERCLRHLAGVLNRVKL